MEAIQESIKEGIREIAKALGIPLLVIWEDDIKNNWRMVEKIIMKQVQKQKIIY